MGRRKGRLPVNPGSVLRSIFALVLLSSAALVGCGGSAGDACKEQDDCASGLMCCNGGTPRRATCEEMCGVTPVPDSGPGPEDSGMTEDAGGEDASMPEDAGGEDASMPEDAGGEDASIEDAGGDAAADDAGA